jgi:hypothetical protein
MTDESLVVESVVFRVAIDGLLVEMFRDFEPEVVGKVGRGIFHGLLVASRCLGVVLFASKGPFHSCAERLWLAEVGAGKVGI